MGKIQKFSFHESGICRWAQNKPNVDGTDRVILKWIRNPIPSAGLGQATKLLELVFPTSHLSFPQVQNKPVKWIHPAPLGYATVVEVILTGESFQYTEAAFASNGQREILAFDQLNPALNLLLARHQTICGSVSLKVPDDANLVGKVFEELDFPEIDTTNSGRPIRMLISKKEEPGDCPVFWELGGFKVGR